MAIITMVPPRVANELYSSANKTNEEYREDIYEEVESALKLFREEPIVKLAKLRYDKLFETLEAQFFGQWRWPSNNEKIFHADNYAMKVRNFFTHEPFFAHKALIKIYINSEDSKPSLVASQPIDYKNKDKNLNAGSIRIDSLSCSLMSNASVQITYLAISEVGISGIDVHLYQADKKIYNGKGALFANRRKFSEDSPYWKKIAESKTDEYGFASFDYMCSPKDGDNVYIVVAKDGNYENNFQELNDRYDALQKVLYVILSNSWITHKPIWATKDIIALVDRCRKEGGIFGQLDGIWEYFSQIFKRAFMPDEYNKIMKKYTKFLDNPRNQKYLTSIGVNRNDSVETIRSMAKHYHNINYILEDPGALYLIVHFIFACTTMNSSDEFQVEYARKKAQLLFQLLIGSMLMVGAKLSKAPKAFTDLLLKFNIANLAMTSVAKFQDLATFTNDMDQLVVAILEHVKATNEVNVKVRTHNAIYELNVRNIQQTERELQKPAMQNTVNINIPNTLD